MAKTTVHSKGQPAVWNLPHNRNLHFVGREQILRDVERGFTGEPARRRAALVGAAGTGKTALAVEYAYSRQEDYDIVWWVRADTQAAMAADLASLAPRLLGSTLFHQENRPASQAVLDELSRRSRWLLIFDNARQSQDLAAYLPDDAAGHVLITSGNVQGNWGGASFLVEPWSRAESVQFLRRRLGGIDDVQQSDKLGAALGDLPLALEQAAACIEQTQMSLGDYLGDFESLWAEMLGQGKPAGPYPAAVAMAWEISLRHIETLSPISAQLLMLCGFFSPDGIPLKMIQEGSKELPIDLAQAVNDPAALYEALALLERFSLIRTDQERISMHGVIGALSQDRLPDIECRQWAAAAVRLVSGAFPFDSQKPQTWPACAQALPHVLSAAMVAHNVQVEPALVVDLQSRAARFLLKQAQYSEAKSILEMAYARVKTAFGERSAAAADIANNLARALHRLGDLATAHGLFELALQIDQQIYGPGDPRLATVANNSAMTLVRMGKLTDARDRFQWALDLYRQTYSREHPKVATVMNNLGYILMLLNQLGGAQQYLEEAMAVTETTCGPNHPQIACIAVNLGILLKGRGRIAEARQLFGRALLIDETTLGGSHPSVARDLLELGKMLREEKESEAAVWHLERALAIVERSYGPAHQETVACLNELGRALKETGNVDRAVDCLVRAAALTAKEAKRAHETVVGDEGMIG